MKNKILLWISFILLISFSTGCVSKKFDANYKQFKDSYVQATDFVDTVNDSLKALKNMDPNVVETKLKEMKVAMDNMSNELNSRDEKGIYGNVQSYYQYLEFLLYAHKNFDKLSIEEKGKVYIDASLVSDFREDIKEGKE